MYILLAILAFLFATLLIVAAAAILRRPGPIRKYQKHGRLHFVREQRVTCPSRIKALDRVSEKLKGEYFFESIKSQEGIQPHSG